MGKLRTSSETLVSSPQLRFEFKGEVKIFQLFGEQLTLGRQPSCQLVIDSHWSLVSSYQAILQREDINYRIYDGNGIDRPSTNGIFFNNVRVPLREGMLLRHGNILTIGSNPQHQILIHYENPLDFQENLTSDNQIKTLTLDKSPIIIGRDRRCDFVLESPLVSRHHATIETTPQGNHLLRDLNSTNGVFSGGQRIAQQMLRQDTAFQIGPYSLIYRGKSIHLSNTDGNLRIDACDLLKEVKIQGKKRCILYQVSMPIEPGQLVAIVGGSGAGKSTLMKALLGINSTQKGIVLINGKSLRDNYNLYRTQLGYVPQDDIIHSELTVTEALTYAAQLRLSSDLDNDEIKKIVAATLEDIEMTSYRHNLIENLSGGQRKRISIGVELLANPKLFFLDEPTSGLDPGLDKKMMLLLRKLANAGRTIMLVTHATANIQYCDRLAFMGRGGKLCYYGPPTEILSFFQLPQDSDFADIYNQLEEGEERVNQWHRYFIHSSHYQTYVTYPLSNSEVSSNLEGSSRGNKSTKSTQKKSLPGPFSVRQFWFLTQRYFQLVLRDRLSLILALVPAPTAIALMAMTVEQNNILVKQTVQTDASQLNASLALRVLFVLTCAAMWVGFSSSLQTLVKELSIYLRERLVNLRLLPYLSSKIVVLSAIAAVQTLLVVGVLLLGFDSPTDINIEGPFNLQIGWQSGVVITTFLTCFTSMNLGLAVSAFVNNATQANSALPLLLLPQIVFSGVLFDLVGDMASFSAKLMLSHWSIRAYASLIDVNSLGWPPTFEEDILENYENIYSQASLFGNWGMLILHGIVYSIITLFLQRRKDLVK